MQKVLKYSVKVQCCTINVRGVRAPVVKSLARNDFIIPAFSSVSDSVVHQTGMG
jgi:hypothetical protein